MWEIKKKHAIELKNYRKIIIINKCITAAPRSGRGVKDNKRGSRVGENTHHCARVTKLTMRYTTLTYIFIVNCFLYHLSYAIYYIFFSYYNMVKIETLRFQYVLFVRLTMFSVCCYMFVLFRSFTRVIFLNTVKTKNSMNAGAFLIKVYHEVYCHNTYCSSRDQLFFFCQRV